MKNFVSHGEVITVPAPAALTSGEGVLVGTIFGVAQTAAASGADVAIVVEGVFELPKVGSQAWTVGAKVYWDVSEAHCTTVSTDNTLIGVAAAAVADGAGDTLGHVRLGQVA